MMLRRTLCGLTIWLLAAGCQRGPTSPSPSPSPSPLPLIAGVYEISFTGAELPVDPALPPCPPAGVPPGGKYVLTRVVLTQEGSEWVGRLTSSSEGDLNVRLRHGGHSIFGPVVAGSVTGTVAPGPPRHVGVSLDGTVDATLSAAGLIVNGRIQGSIVFHDATSASASCSVVSLFMIQISAP
jgi:hypothetical protein